MTFIKVYFKKKYLLFDKYISFYKIYTFTQFLDFTGKRPTNV